MPSGENKITSVAFERSNGAVQQSSARLNCSGDSNKTSGVKPHTMGKGKDHEVSKATALC